MNKCVIRATAVSVPAVPLLLLIGIGTVNAYTAPTAEGGGGGIQAAVVPSPELKECHSWVDNVTVSPQFGGAGQPTSTLLENVAVGSHIVTTNCTDTMNVKQQFGVKVDVAAPDAMLDGIDKALAGAGSSALTSDPTLR